MDDDSLRGFGDGFSDRTIRSLAEPLDVGRVRLLGGDQDKPYLEVAGIVHELNRVFGFDGWSSEIVRGPELVGAPELAVKRGEYGKEKPKQHWIVRAVCVVRVTTRDGGSHTGTGYHESFQGEGNGPNFDLALKSAESDALKRAASWFGNPFGLSLRDKMDRLGEASHEQMLKELEAQNRADQKVRQAEPEPAPRREPPRDDPPRREVPPPEPPVADRFSDMDRRALQDDIDRIVGRWMESHSELPKALAAAGIVEPGDLFAPESKLPTVRLRDIARAVADQCF